MSPANWPGQFSQKGWLGLMGFHFLFYTLIFIYFFKYETIVSRNGLSLGYSEQDTSSVSGLKASEAPNSSI